MRVDATAEATTRVRMATREGTTRNVGYLLLRTREECNLTSEKLDPDPVFMKVNRGVEKRTSLMPIHILGDVVEN